VSSRRNWLRQPLLVAVLVAAAILAVVALVAPAPAPAPEPAPAPAPAGDRTATYGLAGQHVFTASDPATRWEVHRLDDEDDDDSDSDDPVATATGASATFELSANDDQPVTYEVRAGERTQRITVLPAGVVTRFDRADANAPVRTYAVVPATLSRATHLLLVMHGHGRNAEDYCESWVDWAAKSDYIVLCPEFDEDDWPGSAGYNLGNVFTGDNGTGQVNPEEKWAFTVAEQVPRRAATDFALDDRLFDMWGHSAGAQFVHRFVLFKPQSAVRYAIAANAGWYTAAAPATAFPYGLQNPVLHLGASYTREHLVIMRGGQDDVVDDQVRTDPGAEAQGHTRFERAGFAYAAAPATDPHTNWQLIDVPRADHDQIAMSAAAQRFLLDHAAALPHRCPLPNGDVCPN
jgi:hypothetical protein